MQAASPVPAIAHRTATTLRLGNGSSIVALPGDRPDTVRGLTLDLAAVDEAAFVKAEVLRVLLPMLATTGGTMAMLSTPSRADRARSTRRGAMAVRSGSGS